MTEITYEKEKDYGYMDRMLLNLKSEYLIDAAIRNLNGKSEYCYEVKNKIPMSEMFKSITLTERDINSLFSAMALILDKLQEHLLKPDGLILSPDRIMYSVEDRIPAFIYCPAAIETYGADSIRLGEFLINKVDVTNESAVKLCYAFYEAVNATKADLRAFLKEHIREHISADFRKGNTIPSSVSARPDTSKEKENTTDSSGKNRINDKNEPQTEEEQYYYKAPVYEDEEDNPLINIPEKGLLKLLIICSALVVIAGSAYTYIFLNPALLKAAGISQKDYIIAGAVLTSIMAMIIISLLQMYVHRHRESEQDQKSL